MKSLKTIQSIVLFAVLSFSAMPLHAQLIAGTVPSGAVLATPNTILAVTVGADSIGIDLNCDMVDDLRFVVSYGSSLDEIPNSAGFTVLDSTIRFCMDTTPGLPLPMIALHDAGDTLNCSGSFSWSADQSVYLGYYGCTCPPAPEQEFDRYIHYQFGSQEGWIKVSFDLNNFSAPIQAEVHEFTSWCVATEVTEEVSNPTIRCYPNPSLDGLVRVETPLAIRQVTVYDTKGALVRQGALSNNLMELPEQPGLYLLVFEDQNGKTFLHKAIRR